MGSSVRAIALYLPQFHPIPENDAWWGAGFTEWRNVVKAKPQFSGHYQPHLPGELGFYDLRLSEARAAQARLAAEHLIHGFCYYHYWFDGRRILERPLDELLAGGEPNFPFCLCWANENWTRRWDGQDQEILLEQRYSDDGDRRHIEFLCGVFDDPRYIRVDGKPLFLVYRSSLLPDPKRTTDIWREYAAATGIGDLYLVRFEGAVPGEPPEQDGFDAAAEFGPDFGWLKRTKGSLAARALHHAGIRPCFFSENKVTDYRAFVQRMLARPGAPYKRYPGVTPMWDNTPRRNRNAAVLRDSTPDLYGDWLSRVVQTFQPYSAEENLVFVNAWNEWAEGNHLEPDERWGRGYLEATRDALAGSDGG